MLVIHGYQLPYSSIRNGCSSVHHDLKAGKPSSTSVTTQRRCICGLIPGLFRHGDCFWSLAIVLKDFTRSPRTNFCILVAIISFACQGVIIECSCYGDGGICEGTGDF